MSEMIKYWYIKISNILTFIKLKQSKQDFPIILEHRMPDHMLSISKSSTE